MRQDLKQWAIMIVTSMYSTRINYNIFNNPKLQQNHYHTHINKLNNSCISNCNNIDKNTYFQIDMVYLRYDTKWDHKIVLNNSRFASYFVTFLWQIHQKRFANSGRLYRHLLTFTTVLCFWVFPQNLTERDNSW